MDRNTIIGFLLLAGLFFLYVKMNAPSDEELAEQKRIQDSIELVERQHTVEPIEESVLDSTLEDTKVIDQAINSIRDSLENIALKNSFGSFADYLEGKEAEYSIENKEIKVTFTNKGAKVKSVLLKKYNKILLNKEHKERKLPLYLMEDVKNRFNFSFPLGEKTISTENLFFNVDEGDNSIVFKVQTPEGEDLEFIYSIQDEYQLALDIRSPYAGKSIHLEWQNYLDRIEYNTTYESMYSTVYYKEKDNDTDHCKCTGEDREELDGTPLKWISHSNQFFNTTLIAVDQFDKGIVQITPFEEEESDDLKLAQTQLDFTTNSEGNFAMQMYVGPNEFNRLKSLGLEMEYIIPFGTSIFGTINRYMIRPFFDFLTGFVGVKGLAIVLLTLFVKLLLYPLTFRMLKSQSKMAALKPVLEKMKTKHKDDAQKQQMETMKTYREYGVNPLGGCMPMLLQMPIWFALYRFFPASITFRQASFLWATDLSSYDVIAWLPFEIPFYGDHISLFTILWAVSLVIYTYYNSRYMDYSAQPAMKYMQYLMPFMFLFYFNNFASGLSCYLFFSNVMNISQNLITKNYIIDQEKIKEGLRKNKEKPKKKGGFQARLEKALKEQQKMADQQKKNKK
jgi:YidC/Oxa1 family membrane protein insertase